MRQPSVHLRGARSEDRSWQPRLPPALDIGTGTKARITNLTASKRRPSDEGRCQ